MEFYLSVQLSRFDSRIGKVIEMGFNPEIRMMLADHLARTGPDELARMRDLLEANSLKTFTHGPFFGLDIASLDRCLSEYSADCLFAGLEATRALGADLMIMHTAYLPQFSRGGRRHWFANWAERMPAVIDRAGSLGVTIALENTWDDRPEIMLHLADLLPGDSVRFCLDTGHVNAFSRLSADCWLDAVSDRLVALHLHDNDGASDDHLAPGRGTFDFPSLAAHLKKMKEMPLLDLEVGLDEAEAGRDYIENLLAGASARKD